MIFRYFHVAVTCLLIPVALSEIAEKAEENVVKDDILKVEGRGVRDMAKNFWDFFFGEGDGYDYSDYYDFNPSDVSSYTWYDAGSARQDTFDLLNEEEEPVSWGEIAMGATLAIVPIGLLLAALPAGLFTIAVKKRSFGDDDLLQKIDPTELPLLRSLQEGDLMALVRPQCQKKLYCELSQLGKSENASFLQRSFYFLSHIVPDNMAKRFRLRRMFTYARENKCEKFSCKSTTKSIGLTSPSNHLKAPNNKDLDAE